MKITKEEFDLLYDNDISKKQYDVIINKIDDRFGEVFHLIRKIQGIKESDSGDLDYNTGSDEKDGFFDINRYSEDICFISDMRLKEPYVESFPTRFLWEDCADEIKKKTDACIEALRLSKEKKKETLELRKQKKQDMKRIISSKLTVEELKFIKFK